MNLKHGIRYTKAYGILKQVKSRCYNPNHTMYNLYGARGIKVCDIWMEDPVNFYLWAMDTGYKEGLVIQLIDKDKDFSPWNCEWITKEEFYSKKRAPQIRQTLIEINGEEKSIREWAQLSGISIPTLYRRVREGSKGSDLLRPLDARGRKAKECRHEQ